MKRGREEFLWEQPSVKQCREQYQLAVATNDWKDNITDMMWKRFRHQPISTIKMAKLAYNVEALYSLESTNGYFANTQKQTLNGLLTEFRQEHEQRRITFLGILIKYILPDVKDLQQYLVNLVWKQQQAELSELCRFFRRRTIVSVSCPICLHLDHDDDLGVRIQASHDKCHVRRLTWVDDLI